MGGRIYSYINRRGEYVRVGDEEAREGSPTKDPSRDYFKGVKPSDLAGLDNRQLYVAADRIHESVVSGVGTPEERAGASEALSEVYRERKRRRSSIR